MKIYELIAELQKQDPNADIYLDADESLTNVESVNVRTNFPYSKTGYIPEALQDINEGDSVVWISGSF